MIADTTFVSDLVKERRRARRGAATDLFNRHRAGNIRTTIITAAEIAVILPTSSLAWDWLNNWKICPLHRGIAEVAADIDCALRTAGHRLGENDTWIAGFAAYCREPLISHDAGFDCAPGGKAGYLSARLSLASLPLISPPEPPSRRRIPLYD